MARRLRGSMVLALWVAAGACATSSAGGSAGGNPTPAPQAQPPPTSKVPAESHLAAGLDSSMPSQARTPKEINDTIRAKATQLSACYDDQLDVEPDLAEGKLVLSFRIDEQGFVTDLRVNETSTLTHPVVARCIMDIFLHLEYPANNEVIVNYPLIFRRASGS